LICNSPKETRELGRWVGAKAGPGTLLGLVGDLGAGKTQFVKGVAVGAGVPDENAVTSPTFVLMNLYAGRLRVAHFDLYRLDAVDLQALGFYDVLEDSLVVVEWADKVDAKRLGDHLRISFEVTGETSRSLVLEAHGPRSSGLLSAVSLGGTSGDAGPGG